MVQEPPALPGNHLQEVGITCTAGNGQIRNHVKTPTNPLGKVVLGFV